MAIMAPIVINLIHTSKRSFPNKNNLTYIKTYHTDHEIIHTHRNHSLIDTGVSSTHTTSDGSDVNYPFEIILIRGREYYYCS